MRIGRYFYQYEKGELIGDGYVSGWIVFDRGGSDPRAPLALCISKAMAAKIRDLLNAEDERRMRAIEAENERNNRAKSSV
jgi:hypothetical protein